ncbi:MAG: hypothetical protein HYV14_02175 [Elusimicrobia bacterium]|nr:hypothetical protein [Elusimicrobiota bacterium]
MFAISTCRMFRPRALNGSGGAIESSSIGTTYEPSGRATFGRTSRPSRGTTWSRSSSPRSS